MINAAKARELVQEMKDKRMKELVDFIEREKISEKIISRASQGYHNTSFTIKDEYLTVVTEYFNKLGFSVGYTPKYTQTEVEISW